ncbi:hypothetical protein RI056_17435 [Komagataeibacter nataicola]|nr:hypothetical protein [Komagataeibacter nataicola]WNM08582.1 hypothetical protein RI056_17435 [Komagataeibacter nataicola]
MTRICGNASEFAHSALHGYSLVYRDIVRMVRGGVVRAKAGRAGKVAVVVGVVQAITLPLTAMSAPALPMRRWRGISLPRHPRRPSIPWRAGPSGAAA